MERLTRRSKVGEGLPVNHLNLMHMDTTSEDTLTKILDELADYEDTGLTPQQLKEIDKLYLEKCEEVNRLKEKRMPKKVLRKKCDYCLEEDCGNCNEYANRCPSCKESLDYDNSPEYDYCPNCGQRLDGV